MKSSNLAWRLDDAAEQAAAPDAPPRLALQVLAAEQAGRSLPPARRRRSFDERTIVIRDQGFRPFRVG